MHSGFTSGLAAYVNRLAVHSQLSGEEQQVILAWKSERSSVPAREDLVLPGETVNHAILVADGLLGRFNLMQNGTRQITAIYVPGDMADLHSVVSPTASWGVTALTASIVLRVPHSEFTRSASRYPNLAKAFWRDTTLDASILAKWVANLGRKGAKARLAHLLCEMGARMERAGRGTRRAYALALTQDQIADAVGLTPVHVNRTLQALRADGLLARNGQRVELPDWRKLALIADFDPAYLLMTA